MAKFFYIPFAQNGDMGTPVPDEAQPNGSVSYYAGFGSNYQLPLASGGAALPINRVQFNSMMNDVTGALQNIQTQGIFSWIGPVADAPLSGANYPYPINALVYYTDGNIYQSLIANNQDIPGATMNWANVSLNSGVPIGSVIDYAGLVIPTNCLNCDGMAYSRATYAALFSAITNSQNGNTYSSTTVDTLTSTANLEAGFYVSGPGVQAGTTIASITNSTSLILSMATLTTVVANPLVFSPWGIGDGSTTFNVPDLQRQVTMGSGGTAISGPANTIGSQGGEEAHTMTTGELVSHDHSLPGLTGSANNAGGPSGSSDIGSKNTTTTTGNTGSSTPFNVVQPSVVLFKCIKFQ